MKKKSKVNPLNLSDDAKVIHTNPRTGETTEMTMSDYKKSGGATLQNMVVPILPNLSSNENNRLD